MRNLCQGTGMPQGDAFAYFAHLQVSVLTEFQN